MNTKLIKAVKKFVPKFFKTSSTLQSSTSNDIGSLCVMSGFEKLEPNQDKANSDPHTQFHICRIDVPLRDRTARWSQNRLDDHPLLFSSSPWSSLPLLKNNKNVVIFHYTYLLLLLSTLFGNKYISISLNYMFQLYRILRLLDHISKFRQIKLI